jgi:hypothetical protein
MDFINKGIPSFLVIALIFIAVIFVINILPFILIAAAGIWAVTYAVKKIKLWRNDKSVRYSSKSNVEVVKNSYEEDFSEKNIVDVEYTEVK